MKELVELTIYQLEALEQTKKPIPARDELEKRLAELTQGRSVPVVVFNCLLPTWRQPFMREYPQTDFSFDADTAICKYFQDDIGLTLLGLQDLGTPDLNIVIPDSELLDERVFSFAQTRQERLELGSDSKAALSAMLTGLDNPEDAVKLWSEYCCRQSVRTPAEYTEENYRRIQSDPNLIKKVQGQIKDSTQHFQKNCGIDMSKANPKEVLDRTTWYLAMYMGEGQALLESRAIVLNLEDSRVPAWFQRGANNQLPILTPVNSKDFYDWRKEIK